MAHTVVYLFEPDRFRLPQNKAGEEHLAGAHVHGELFPDQVRASIMMPHARPEPLLGLLEPFGMADAVSGLGYVNRGGTHDRRACFLSIARAGRTAASEARACSSCHESSS